jgi:hypothetical protein
MIHAVLIGFKRMAWIEQTKKGSRKSGGPQYYLQDLTEPSVRTLRSYRRCSVRLWTPYGVIDSGLTAVSKDVGSVEHDRVQSGHKVRSVADQIAYWYNLRRPDIERIEFEDSFDGDGFVIRPSRVKFVGRSSFKTISPDPQPLTIVPGHQSQILTDQLRDLARTGSGRCAWSASQISEIVAEHDRRSRDVDERDLLRASGALDMLGIKLGRYRTKGIDCADARFRVDGYPEYSCPVEIEERSRGFLAGHHAAHRTQRAVLLCMEHNSPQILRGYIDVIELRELNRIMRDVA